MGQDLEEPRGQRVLSCLLLLCLAAIMAMLARPMFSGSQYTYSDLGSFMLPVRYCYWKVLASGDNILWPPQLYCGFYLHRRGRSRHVPPFALAALPLPEFRTGIQP